MDKSPEAFRTISEVADHLQTPAHVLRFWESRFPQVRPVKRAGGRRYYRPSDVALLAGIKQLLHDEGLTIRGVQKILREQGVRHVAALVDDAVAAPAEEQPEAAVAASDAAVPDVDIDIDQEAEDAEAVDDEPAPRQEPLPLLKVLALRKAPPLPETMPIFDRPAPGEAPVIAARLRALPAEVLIARAEALSPLAGRLAILRAAMVERGRLARR